MRELRKVKIVGLSENTRGNQSSGGGVVALIMACLAVVIILLVMQNHRAQNTPTPVPSVSPSPAAFTWYQVATDDEVYPAVAYQVNPGAEGDAVWSCRTFGNGLCGDTGIWTWGIRSFA